MKTLSQKFWSQIESVYQAIVKHPFNQEMMQGSLPKNKFQFYIEQDAMYLGDFSKSLLIIASKAPQIYVDKFMRYVKNSVAAEKKALGGFLYNSQGSSKPILNKSEKEIVNLQPPSNIKLNKTMANIGYTNHLVRTCFEEDVAVGIAAVMPCFWIYSELGILMSQQVKPQNPYANWIAIYSSEKFTADVRDIIMICDKLGKEKDPAILAKMEKAFYTSACFEWHFWDDAYNMNIIDRF